MLDIIGFGQPSPELGRRVVSLYQDKEKEESFCGSPVNAFGDDNDIKMTFVRDDSTSVGHSEIVSESMWRTKALR